MSLDADKILEDLNKLAKPKLEEVAARMQADFKARFSDFMDCTDLSGLDKLLNKAAKYEIEAVTCGDRDKAEQWAEAAADTLRQVALILVTEKIVTEREIANILQEAALAIFEGIKDVALTIVGVAAEGAVKGLLGGGLGGTLADEAGEFLG
jgi:hypothetical protein